MDGTRLLLLGHGHFSAAVLPVYGPAGSKRFDPVSLKHPAGRKEERRGAESAGSQVSVDVLHRRRRTMPKLGHRAL